MFDRWFSRSARSLARTGFSHEPVDDGAAPGDQQRNDSAFSVEVTDPTTYTTYGTRESPHVKAYRFRSLLIGLVNDLAPVWHAGKHRFPARFGVCAFLFSKHAVPMTSNDHASNELREHLARIIEILRRQGRACPCHLVMKVLDPHWKKATSTMGRVRGRIESIRDWAKVRGYRTGENPARWKGHLDQVLSVKTKVKNREAMIYTEQSCTD